jgi:hypothetical protein
MRTKQWISGLNNKQRIRAIINGVGFYTTVQDALSGPFSSQTTALYQILHEFTVSKKEITGVGRRIRVYDHKMQPADFDIQVDLV